MSNGTTKRKVNLPLVEVLVGSLLLHLVAGVILGGLVLYQQLAEPEPEFVPPPEIQRVQPERLEYKVKMKQQQKQSAKPRMKRIQVESPTTISVPQIDIVAPVVSSEVAVGTGMGGGSGSGMGISGGGNLGFGKFEVNFFGIKNKGERIMFLVDASRHILEDHKGGYPAYEIVKKEIAGLVDKMPAGLMFNVAVYGVDGITFFKSDNLQAKNASSAKEVYEWIQPINNSAASAGMVRGQWFPHKEYAPMNDRTRNWTKALIACFKQQPDTIFWIDSSWKEHHLMDHKSEEWYKWLKTQGWDEKRLAEWEANMVKTREWFNNENAERRAKGVPERVVRGMWVVALELGYEIPPHPSFSDKEIVDTLNNAIKDIYKSKGLGAPSVNQVLFQGPEEAKSGQGKALQDRFKYVCKKVGKRGRFKALPGMKALQNVTGRKE